MKSHVSCPKRSLWTSFRLSTTATDTGLQRHLKECVEPYSEMDFPTLDEMMMKESTFNFSETTTLKQRFNDIERQPRTTSGLYPAPLHLLSKKTKRCKTCLKQIVKPNINPTSKEPLKVNFLMIHHITKVTIYRVAKLKADAKEVDLFLQFRNPNMSQAQIQFYPLLDSQAQGKDLNVKLDLPVGQFKIDASE